MPKINCMFVLILLLAWLPLAQAGSDLRLLALGDSYTIGTDVNRKARWPYQLREALGDAGIHMRLDYIAGNGWNSERLLAAIKQKHPQPALGLVTLQIGVNDQFQGVPIELFREHFRKLLARAVALADGRKQSVLVISIPDYSVTPFGHDPTRKTSKEIAAFNQVARTETEAQGIQWIDIGDLVQQASSNPGLIAGGGPHFSFTMYKRWVKKIMPYALAALRGKPETANNAGHGH